MRKTERKPGSVLTTRPTGDEEWPSVSVLVPTHDRPLLLSQAVRSVFDQRYPGHIECLVVFDRQDPERLAVEVPASRELRLLRNDRTAGPAGAYNTGALAARGELLALCDDDDEWLPDKLRLQVECLGRHPHALMCTAGIYTVSRRAHARIPRKQVQTVDDLLVAPRNTTHSSTFLVRRQEVLSRIGLFDEATPGSYGEDVDWLIRIARLGPVVAVREPLVRVRFQYSYFGDRWALIVEALEYMLTKIPEFRRQPTALSKVFARMAFGYVSVGRRSEGRRWARQSIKLNRRQSLAYVAMLMSYRLIRPQTVMRLAHAAGRGV